MRRHAILRPAEILGAAVLLLALTGLPAAADTDLGSSGLVGAHQLRDSQAAPGLRCGYVLAGAPVLDTMTVKAPRVWARDTTTARDTQKVSWQIVVQTWDINGFWDTVALHGPWAAVARDDAPAPFTAKTVEPPLGAGGTYRVLVRLRWLGPSGVVGSSRHRVDWVIRAVPEASWSDTFGPMGVCPEQLAR